MARPARRDELHTSGADRSHPKRPHEKLILRLAVRPGSRGLILGFGEQGLVLWSLGPRGNAEGLGEPALRLRLLLIPLIPRPRDA